MNTLVLPSSTESVSKVEPYVDGLRGKYEIGDDVFGNILISLTEAVNNAIIHGNGCDESKNVTVDCELSGRNNILTFKIKDEGPGFDYNNLPDPTSPENLEKITGRGVFLMKQLADWVIFSEDGSVVEIQFRI